MTARSRSRPMRGAVVGLVAACLVLLVAHGPFPVQAATADAVIPLTGVRSAPALLIAGAALGGPALVAATVRRHRTRRSQQH